MPFYWSLKSIPELAALPPTERRRVWRAALWRVHRDWRMWAAMLVTSLGCALGFVVGGALGWPNTGGIVGAGIGGFLYGQIVVDLTRPHVAAATFALDAGDKRRNLVN